MTMIKYSPYRINGKKEGWYVFLAGPIRGAEPWQHNLPEVPDVTWFSPRRRSYDKFNWEEQTEWEHDHLLSSDIIMFWIPLMSRPDEISLEEYAKTTRTEVGEYLARGKKVIAGIHPGFPGRRYLVKKIAEEYHCGPVYETLEDTLGAVKEYINQTTPKTCFTSDTHFSSQRTLELSRRPYKTVSDMDWDMIAKWNSVIHPGDKVYHLGDFGDYWPLKYLNGEITLVLGNYEDKEMITNGYGPDWYVSQGFYDVLPRVTLPNGLVLAHEPLKVKETGEKGLFGHIHGRQKIKTFGIDVGVDGNNFYPFSEDDVKFYLNAIREGYYDKEVWS